MREMILHILQTLKSIIQEYYENMYSNKYVYIHIYIGKMKTFLKRYKPQSLTLQEIKTWKALYL